MNSGHTSSDRWWLGLAKLTRLRHGVLGLSFTGAVLLALLTWVVAAAAGPVPQPFVPGPFVRMAPNLDATAAEVSVAEETEATEGPAAPVASTQLKPVAAPPTIPVLARIKDGDEPAEPAVPAEDPGIKPLSEIRVRITRPQTNEAGEQLPLPPDYATEYFGTRPPASREVPGYNPWMEDISYAPALNFCYRPLYFEEVNAERYGYSFGLLQPAVSIAEFYGHVVLLPYRLVARRPGFATYHDHQFRPGGTAPREVAVPEFHPLRGW